MTDLIDRRELIKALNKVAMEHHESHIPMVEHDFRELIDGAPMVDLMSLTKLHIYGYTIADLVVFAEACRRMDIEERDMRDFCRSTKNAYEYMQGEYEKKLKGVLK